MAADWPISAQEAAARLFAQALPVPLTPKQQTNQQNPNQNVNFQNIVVNGQKVPEKCQNININNQKSNKTTENSRNVNDQYFDITANCQNVPNNHQNMPSNCQNAKDDCHSLPNYQNINFSRQILNGKPQNVANPAVPHKKPRDLKNVNCQNLNDKRQNENKHKTVFVIPKNAIKPTNHSQKLTKFSNVSYPINIHQEPVKTCQNIAESNIKGVNSDQNNDKCQVAVDYQNDSSQNITKNCYNQHGSQNNNVNHQSQLPNNCQTDSCQNVYAECKELANRGSHYDNVGDLNSQNVPSKGWNGWLACFENGKSENNNVEEILVGADSEVCILFVIFRIAT